MKYSKAYCIEFEDDLSIYEARDLHFDETEDFHIKEAEFLCPDERCRVELRPVNGDKKKFIMTPHFRSCEDHDDDCGIDDGNVGKKSQEPKTTHLKKYREGNFPSEFLLERPKRKKRTKKDKNNENGNEIETVTNGSKPKGAVNREQGVNRTSCLEHLAECYISNMGDKDKLKSMSLTIKGVTRNYNSFFKNIRFFADGDHFIFFGKVKRIKSWGKDYCIEFSDKIKIDENHCQASMYLKKELIDVYRKNRLFKSYIDDMASKQSGDVYCFFIGTPPSVKDVQRKDGETFKAVNVDVVNLDHLTFRYTEDRP